LGKDAPIGPDLVGQDDPGHHAHRETEREHMNPETRQRAIDRLPGEQPQCVDDDDVSEMPML
jgi:hypothetical protein